MAESSSMSSKRRAQIPRPNQDLLTGGALTADDATLMRSFLAESGAPAYLLDAIQPGVALAELLAIAERDAPVPEIPELVAQLGEAIGPALAGKGDPFLAEAATLELLGLLRSAYPGDSVEDDTPELLAKVLELVEATEREATVEALVMLRALALYGPEPVLSAEAADRLVVNGLVEPQWTAQIGSPTPVECFAYGDIFGEQESIAVTFAYGRKRHAMAVLIDHNLGGGVKDCWLSDNAAEIKRQYRSLDNSIDAEYSTYTIAEGLEILQEALAAELCPEQPDQLQDTAAFLPLLRHRVRLMAQAPAKKR
jgi:hypothetical protein